MARGKSLIVWLVVLLLMQSEIILAQQANPKTPETWTAVKSLKTGSDIVVKLKNGKTLKGTYVEATDESLTVSEGQKVTNFNRHEIKKIQLTVERNRDPQHIIGTIAGAGLGVAFAFAGTDPHDGSPQTSVVIVSAVFFAAVGYGLAHLFTPKYKKVLIYESHP